MVGKWLDLAREHGETYVLRELLLYLTDEELKECLEEFNRNHDTTTD